MTIADLRLRLLLRQVRPVPVRLNDDLSPRRPTRARPASERAPRSSSADESTRSPPRSPDADERDTRDAGGRADADRSRGRGDLRAADGPTTPTESPSPTSSPRPRRSSRSARPTRADAEADTAEAMTTRVAAAAGRGDRRGHTPSRRSRTAELLDVGRGRGGGGRAEPSPAPTTGRATGSSCTPTPATRTR